MTTRTLNARAVARLTALAAALLAAVGLLAASGSPLSPFAATPAHAHDELVDQTIVLDETDGSAEAVSLTFSNSVLEVGTEVVITGPEGDATDGAPVTEGPNVTQALQGDLAPGDYTTAWRVVSSDGHPIDGAFQFTITGEEAPGDEIEITQRSLVDSEDGLEDAAVVEPDPRFDEEHDHDHDEADGADEAEASDEGLSFGALATIAAIIVLASIGVTTAAIVSVRRKQRMLEEGGLGRTGGDADADSDGTADGSAADDAEEDAK